MRGWVVENAPTNTNLSSPQERQGYKATYVLGCIVRNFKNAFETTKKQLPSALALPRPDLAGSDRMLASLLLVGFGVGFAGVGLRDN